MIKTPLGTLVAKEENLWEYPCISIYLVKENGEEELINIVEYNPIANNIATFSFKDNEDEFHNKTIYTTV